MDLQKLVDSMNEVSRQTRGRYQMTLGPFIEALENLPPDLPIKCSDGTTPGEPASYRGYYSDLAFEPDGGDVSTGDFLAVVKTALGQTFEGYKGGDFVMAEDTPLWVSGYGMCSNLAIMGVVNRDGKNLIQLKPIE